MNTLVNTENFSRFACEVLDEKRATDIIWLDLRGITDIADEFLIATVTSPRQGAAVVDACEIERKARGLKCLGIEGKGNSSWVVLDYGDLVVHLFTPEARDYYRLEHVWADAAVLEVPLSGGGPAGGSAGGLAGESATDSQ